MITGIDRYRLLMKPQGPPLGSAWNVYDDYAQRIAGR